LLFDGVLLEDPNEGFPLLRVACPDLSRAVLKGERKVMTREDPADNRAGRRIARGSLNAGQDMDAASQSAFDALRDWRRETAREAGVPPYVVFHDQVLRALAQSRPTHADALLSVSGIGEAKARRFGKSILAVLSAHG
jgi:ATP-dependent DNA helicase RecQ